MKVKFFCPRWGFEHIPWKQFLKDVKDAGYDGIEWFPAGDPAEHPEILDLLLHYGLEFSVVMAVVEQSSGFEDYLRLLKERLLAYAHVRKGDYGPLFISAQTGREYYTSEQITQCIDACEEVSRQTQVPIYQETHRNKWSFAAHAVGPVLKARPQLQLTLDLSHWFCVSESYLEDQQDTVEAAIRQARHIHARVGHTEGPQVSDPALPVYAEALEAHLSVWDKWIEQRKASGAAWCSITPEFGPPPYMPLYPGQGPVHEEQWRVNLWIKNLLEGRYSL
jgi:sugar phosphate isomerase/epimerase